MTNPSRRDIGRLTAATAAGVLPTAASAGTARPTNGFPPGFVWGAATSAFQVEGALTEDGRGPSIWDAFSHIPCRIHDCSNADVACDTYHRYPEDVALMQGLGLNAFRFSMAWPRIFPAGSGQPNSTGVDFYRRFVDALLAVRIRPFCTLFHWDLPQALQDKGGWLNRDTAKRFADYAGYVADRIPQIRDYFTLNEMASFVDGGYGDGSNPPGMIVSPRAFAQAKHNAVLAHGLGVRAVRASAHGPLQIGSAEVPTVLIPVTSSAADIAAARQATLEENAAYLTVLHKGSYTEGYLRGLGTDAPTFSAEDLQIISTPTDFQGLNIYLARSVRAADNAAGYEIVRRPDAYPHMVNRWGTLDPDSLYWGPRLFAESMGIRRIYITENGAACSDEASPDGVVYDTDRVMFLRTYLRQLRRAIDDGAPVIGYFHWSLLDNFEWLQGYGQRFGLHHVDFATQQRTPKLSARVYKAIIAGEAP